MLGDKIRNLVEDLKIILNTSQKIELTGRNQGWNEDLNQLIESHKRVEELESIVDKLENDNKEHELNYEYYVSSFNSLKKERDQLKEENEQLKEDTELGKALKLSKEKHYYRHLHFCGSLIRFTTDTGKDINLLDWYRQQKEGKDEI